MMSTMKTIIAIAILTVSTLSAQEQIINPQIDWAGFQRDVIATGKIREQRRITEDQFLAMMKEPGTVVLDARTPFRFDQRHITGAVSLPFTEFSDTSLAKVIPTKATRILIYCNNNFRNAPESMFGKRIEASLNVSTFTGLLQYGYSNVYELGPNLDVRTTKLPFSGTEVRPTTDLRSGILQK